MSSSLPVQVEEIQYSQQQRDDLSGEHDAARPMLEHDASSSMTPPSPPVTVDQVHSELPQVTMPSTGQIVRPKRITRVPDRLIVGDPSHPRFNRTMY